MTNDEVMNLARRVLCAHPDPMHPTWMSMGALSDAAMKFAIYIVSGDMKREIENAAFERAAQIADEASKIGMMDSRIEIASRCGMIGGKIRSLIQPPVQTGREQE